MSEITIQPADAMITLENVNKWYGQFHVLKDINLNVKQGERIVLCGPSGSGKSTTIRCINHLEEHQQGRIVVDGIELNDDIRNIDRVRNEVGMVFQHFNLFPHLTVLQNCTLAPIWVKKMPKKEAELLAMHYLERVRIAEHAHKFPGQISGGQQQRVALARALVFEPKLVLMDEPLGALDKQLREHMQMEIKHLHEKFGLTIVYVTHDQSEALTMSDRVAVFHQGEIQQIDDPKTLYEAPTNSFVAQFIGENNQLHGVVQSIDGEHCIVRMPGGELLHALAINIAGPGEATTLSIRPERILIGEAAKQCTNVVQGQIREFVYLGDHIRLCIETCGNSNFIVKIPANQLDSNIRFGEEIQIGWHTEYTRALDATANQ